MEQNTVRGEKMKLEEINQRDQEEENKNNRLGKQTQNQIICL